MFAINYYLKEVKTRRQIMYFVVWWVLSNVPICLTQTFEFSLNTPTSVRLNGYMDITTCSSAQNCNHYGGAYINGTKHKCFLSCFVNGIIWAGCLYTSSDTIIRTDNFTNSVNSLIYDCDDKLGEGKFSVETTGSYSVISFENGMPTYVFLGVNGKTSIKIGDYNQDTPSSSDGAISSSVIGGAVGGSIGGVGIIIALLFCICGKSGRNSENSVDKIDDNARRIDDQRKINIQLYKGEYHG
jgi:hypothetical protein